MNKKSIEELKEYDDDLIKIVRIKREINLLKKTIAEAEYVANDREYKYKQLRDSGEAFEDKRLELENSRISVSITGDADNKEVIFKRRQYLVIEGYLSGVVQHFEEDEVKLDDIAEAPSSEHASILVVLRNPANGADGLSQNYKEFPYVYDAVCQCDLGDDDEAHYAEILSPIKKLATAKLGKVYEQQEKLIEEIRSHEIIIIRDCYKKSENISTNGFSDESIFRKIMALMNNLPGLEAVVYGCETWIRNGCIEKYFADDFAPDNIPELVKEKCGSYAVYEDGRFVFIRRDDMNEIDRLSIEEAEERKDLVIQRLENEMKTLKNENNALRVANKAIKESYSWKITKPVRDIGGLFIGKK